MSLNKRSAPFIRREIIAGITCCQEIRSLINSRINVLPLPHAQLALAVVQKVPTPTVPSGDQTAPTCTGHITIHRLPPLQWSAYGLQWVQVMREIQLHCMCCDSVRHVCIRSGHMREQCSLMEYH